MLHSADAIIIKIVPINWFGWKLFILPFVARNMVPMIMNRNPIISCLTKRSLKKVMPMNTVKSISTFISSDAFTAVIWFNPYKNMIGARNAPKIAVRINIPYSFRDMVVSASQFLFSRVVNGLFIGEILIIISVNVAIMYTSAVIVMGFK